MSRVSHLTSCRTSILKPKRDLRLPDREKAGDDQGAAVPRHDQAEGHDGTHLRRQDALESVLGKALKEQQCILHDFVNLLLRGCTRRHRGESSTLVGAVMNSSYFSSSTMVFTRISHSEDHTELENRETVRCEASLARGPTCQSQAAEKSLYPIPETNVCCQGPCVSPSASSRYSFACASPSIAS